jgi:hypothetical protein
MKPQIIVPDSGIHNSDLAASRERLLRDGFYKDLSCVLVIPAFGTVPTKVVSSWWNSMFPPNQRIYKVFAVGMEVGEAFTSTFEHIIQDPTFNKCKYIVTVEHDNIGPQDGFVKLLSHMDNNSQYAAISGLYWTKGPGGAPQIWGDPKDPIVNYRPQVPDPNGGLVECCGVGMGYTAFRLDMFKDTRLRRPWFKTTSSMDEGSQTQDLYFWGDARKYGYRCAVACDVLVGHYDYEGTYGIKDFVW